MISKLEQDIRLLRKSHDEKLEQQVQTSTIDSEQLYSEIRALKRLCDEKEDEVRNSFPPQTQIFTPRTLLHNSILIYYSSLFL